jgi:hypothetical protein
MRSASCFRRPEYASFRKSRHFAVYLGLLVGSHDLEVIMHLHAASSWLTVPLRYHDSSWEPSDDEHPSLRYKKNCILEASWEENLTSAVGSDSCGLVTLAYEQFPPCDTLMGWLQGLYGTASRYERSVQILLANISASPPQPTLGLSTLGMSTTQATQQAPGQGADESTQASHTQGSLGHLAPSRAVRSCARHPVLLRINISTANKLRD